MCLVCPLPARRSPFTIDGAATIDVGASLRGGDMCWLHPRGIGVVLLVSVGVAGLLCGDPSKDASAEKIAALVRQLGSESFNEREAAGKALEAVGERALPALRLAVGSPDPEVRRRADDLIHAILKAAC